MDPGMFTKDGLQKPDKFKLPDDFQDNRSNKEIEEQEKAIKPFTGGKRRSRRSSKKRKASKKAKKSRRRKSSRKGRK